jgi:hypothetical protein
MTRSMFIFNVIMKQSFNLFLLFKFNSHTTFVIQMVLRNVCALSYSESASVADPDPGIRCLFDPGIRKRFFPDPGSQTHIF